MLICGTLVHFELDVFKMTYISAATSPSPLPPVHRRRLSAGCCNADSQETSHSVHILADNTLQARAVCTIIWHHVLCESSVAASNAQIAQNPVSDDGTNATRPRMLPLCIQDAARKKYISNFTAETTS
jgi:hypothetical protein